MQTTPTHLIFATNFSETCHAAIPTVAQLVDRLRARLTILHVHAKGKRAQAQQSLDAFFAEASNYQAASARSPAAPQLPALSRSAAAETTRCSSCPRPSASACPGHCMFRYARGFFSASAPQC